eukprot:9329895-Alexandrium_andersonii.AAC.1
MSASLVGSEMCIRDSPLLDAWASAAVHLDSEPAVRRAAFPQRPRRSPVSYTHLTLPTICSV